MKEAPRQETRWDLRNPLDGQFNTLSLEELTEILVIAFPPYLSISISSWSRGAEVEKQVCLTLKPFHSRAERVGGSVILVDMVNFRHTGVDERWCETMRR